jgi:hypothetical protein
MLIRVLPHKGIGPETVSGRHQANEVIPGNRFDIYPFGDEKNPLFKKEIR